MKGRPVIFTGIADLPAPLATQSFEIVTGPDYSGRHCMMQNDITGLELDNMRYRLETCVHGSRRQIKSLYRRLRSEVEAIRDFDASFQKLAIPLLIIAVLADRTPSGSSEIVPQLLKGLDIVHASRRTQALPPPQDETGSLLI
jgi:hypothetical protein